MDTTETYIKMCDCPEIQGVAPWDLTDHIASRAIVKCDDGSEIQQDGLLLFFDSRLVGSMSTEPYPLRFIWLPRQDQLQEMVGGFQSFPVFWREFNGYENDFDIDEPEWSYCKDFASMEQLWLAFYMFEEFNKTWTGTEWK